ncbi:MAG: glycosyltransferase family 9 protein [Candidatus Delongbacteria bacterium]|nr:glycosyltransferase family 9 protein [Candidatus Delongbacteria bacterium]
MKKKCLIFFTIGIGDSLMVTPVIEKIKDLDGYELEALTISPQVTDIVQNSGFFNKVHFINFLKEDMISSLKSVLKVRKNRYDISILVFPSNNFKYQIVHFLIGAEQRFGIRYLERNFPNLNRLSGKLLKENRSVHAIEQNFRLFEFALGIKIERSVKMTVKLISKDRELAEDYIKSNSLSDKVLVGIHAGSDKFKNMEKKRWGSGKYIELIRSFSDLKNIHFILFGGKPENGLNEMICSESGENCTVLKNVTFFHSAALISRCSAFICGDTGLMHTASALQVPVIAIFGPTSSLYAAPLNEGSVVVKKDYPCVPCYEYSRTPLLCDQDKKYKCLEDITVEEIAKILKSKLKV